MTIDQPAANLGVTRRIVDRSMIGCRDRLSATAIVVLATFFFIAIVCERAQAQAQAPSADQAAIRGSVVPFNLTDFHCLPNQVTAFPTAAGSWQDLAATAVAMAETLSKSGRSAKVAVTRVDLDGISLPDPYYRLAEAYYDPSDRQWLIEAIKAPLPLPILRAMALREQALLRAHTDGRRSDEKRATTYALKAAGLPATTRMPDVRPSAYVTFLSRHEIQIDIGADAKTALQGVARRCP